MQGSEFHIWLPFYSLLQAKQDGGGNNITSILIFIALLMVTAEGHVHAVSPAAIVWHSVTWWTEKLGPLCGLFAGTVQSYVLTRVLFRNQDKPAQQTWSKRLVVTLGN